MATTGCQTLDGRLERSRKQYGQTIAKDQARVHLGDVMQDVSIGGDVHIHYHHQIDDLNKASTVIELLQTCQELLVHYHWLKNRQYDELKAFGLKTVLEKLAVKCALLNRERSCVASEIERGDKRPDLQQILERTYADATFVSRSLDALRFTFDKGEDTQNNDVDAELLRSSFLENWKKYSLEERILSCHSYRASINKYFNHVLNGQRNALEPGIAGNDFVEVLTMHSEIRAGLQPLGAVLKTKKGDSVMVTLPSFKDLQKSTMPDAQAMALVRYNLEPEPEPASAGSEFGSLITTVPSFVHTIKSKLSFLEESYRRIEVREAHRETFKWIFDTSGKNSYPHFRVWLEGNEGLFWINGKAGSGKSTLMKFIQQHEMLKQHSKKWVRNRQLLTFSFFFWAAGQTLQKSYEGILRSLLHQILEARPDMTAVMFPDLSRHLLYQCASSSELNDIIPTHVLYEAVKLFFSTLPADLAVFLIIDGVDEFTGDDLEFSKFVVDLATRPFVKVLVSSRPTPACTQAFSSFHGLQLHELTDPDIRAYIETELTQDPLLIDMEALEPGFAADIKNVLVDKASGVFLWIYLVVRTVLQGLGEYDERDLLMQKIDALPTDLERLYDHMFTKMSPENRQEGCFLLKLITRGRQAQSGDLTALQVFAASKHYHTKTTCSVNMAYGPQHDDLRIKAIDGKLRSRCCGLVEVQYRNGSGSLATPRVDFLHRTVYDYLHQPSISARVEEDSGITQDKIDFLLLVSAAHLMKKPPIDLSQEQYCDRFQNLFEACVNYSYILDKKQDDEYVPFLSTADELAQRHTLCYPHRDIYTEAFSSFSTQNFLSVPSIANYHLLNAPNDPLTKSVLAFAIYGFSTVFEYKLRMHSLSVISKAYLLLAMLTLRRTRGLSSVLLAAYAQNIECLLAFDSNPNCGVAIGHGSDPNGEILRQACLASGRIDVLSPWDFWISQSLETIGDLYTSIRLLEAGEPDQSDKGGPRKREALLLGFYGILENYKNKGIWPKTPLQSLSVESLPIMPARITPFERKRKLSDRTYTTPRASRKRRVM